MKRFKLFLIILLICEFVASCRLEAHTTVNGHLPKTGDMITGMVFIENNGCSGCVVEERNIEGKLMNATCTDESGSFSLRIIDPRDTIWVRCYKYDQERNLFLDYMELVSHKEDGGQDYRYYRHEINGTKYEIYLDDAVIASPRNKQKRSLLYPEYYSFIDSLDSIKIANPIDLSIKLEEFAGLGIMSVDKKILLQENINKRRDEIKYALGYSKQYVTSSGKKPKANSFVTGVIMDNTGPLVAKITIRDSRDRIVSETESKSNGEFSIKIKKRTNQLCVILHGYNEMRTKLVGDRFVFNMQETDYALIVSDI